MSRMGSRLSSLRTARGITRKQLAKAIGVTEKYIEEVESGKKIINDELLRKISKILEQDVGEPDIYDAPYEQPEKKTESPVKQQKKEVNEQWYDALGSVLKTVPVYGYDLVKVIGTRQLPVVSNKIEGHSKEKVLFLAIQDNEMIGFRIMQGDTAFGYMTQEIENNSICLVEYEGRRIIRQLKRLDGDKLLMVSNNGRLATETVSARALKVLARLVRVEINL